MAFSVTHKGYVTKVSDGIAYVRIEQISACAECRSSSLCAASEKQEKIIETFTDGKKVAVGDLVNIVGKQSQAYMAILIAFVLPMILMLSVLLITKLIALWSDTSCAFAALVTLALFYFVLWLFRNNIKAKFTFHIENI
ncbi:MAG: hypothetical protein EOL95_06600 [Bacteroidia bacterium]|nr:hypothetical protein [Bacteroidia bacterium]